MTVPIRFVKPSDLRATFRGLAIMSALFGKDECRFWTEPSLGVDLGVWRDASGKRCYYLFAPKGAALLGFDPESPMSPGNNTVTNNQPWPGIYEEMPKELKELISQNPFGGDFKIEEVTFIIWNNGKGLDWRKGRIEYPARDTGDPDGSRLLLGQIREYFDHFEEEMDEEYGRNFDADALFVLFAGEPVGVEELKRVKSDIDLDAVRDRLKVVGVTV